jgi:hypothetical protein
MRITEKKQSLFPEMRADHIFAPVFCQAAKDKVKILKSNNIFNFLPMWTERRTQNT